MKFVALIPAALWLSGCGGAVLSEGNGAGDGWSPPEAPVELVLPALAGGDVDLARLRGRPVLVNYFATWCVPCAAELPRLQRVFGGPGGELAVVAVSLDAKRKTAQAFVEVSRITFPVAMADAKTLAGETPFGPLEAVPTSYLLDREGRAAERFRGVVPIAYVQRRASELSKRSVQTSR